MNNDQLNYNNTAEEAREGSIKDTMVRYLFHWKWFVLSLVVSLTIGFVYLRYQTPLYEVSARILIKDDKNGGVLSETSAFEDLGILKTNKNLENEIEILRSRALMTLVAKELNLNVNYFVKGRPLEHERFFDSPILASYFLKDSGYVPNGNWQIIVGETGFDLLSADGDFISKKNYGDNIETDFGKIVITKTPFFSNYYLNKKMRILIYPIDVAVDNYLGAISIYPTNKNSNAITITLRDPIADKAAAIVDNLIKQHNLDAIADKNQVSKNTANFISERINFITGELNIVEEEAQNYKSKNKLTDIESEAKLFLTSGDLANTGYLQTSTELSVADFMLDYLGKSAGNELIPANLGLSDVSIATQINEYNKLWLEKNRIQKNSTEKNPVVE
jgi:hypothetical protein